MRPIINKFIILARILLWPVYAISRIFPRDKRIWVFGSWDGTRFADNPKYLFLYVSQRVDKAGVRPIWLTRSKNIARELVQNGLEAYWLYSFQGLYFALRSGVWVIDNKSNAICFWLSNGAIIMNLYHGIPLKKIEKDSTIYQSRKSLKYKFIDMIFTPWNSQSSLYYIASSDIVRQNISTAFRCNINRVFVTGLPRNDIFTDKFNGYMIGAGDLYQDIRKQCLGKKVITYLPTFRDTGDSNNELLNNLSHFDELIEKNDTILLIKLHPNLINDKLACKCRNTFIINPHNDVYPYLAITDLLITDYSSVFFDFMLRERPIIFYCYDLEKYLKTDREMYFDYDQITPGAKVRDYGELISELKHYWQEPYRLNDNYQMVRELIHKTDNELSSKLIFAKLNAQLSRDN